MERTNKVEEFMPKVRQAIERHVKDRDAIADIYNRAYEAVWHAIDKYSSKDENIKCQNK